MLQTSAEKIHISSVIVAFAGLIISGVTAGCGGPPGIDEYQTGRLPGYDAGIPSFDLETVPSAPGRPAGFDLYLSVPATSMTFEKVGEHFRAMQEVRVALQSPGNKSFVLDRSWTDTTVVPSYAATQRRDPFLIRRHLDVPAGLYIVEATLENLSSEKSEVRRQHVDVPDSADRNPYIGKILVQALTDRGRFLPVVTFHVPSGLDSLRCVATLCNLDPARPAVAALDLVRYFSDTLPAPPPMMLTVIDLPLGYGVVKFDRSDTVQVRTLPVAAGSMRDTLSMPLRGLPPGNYRATFQVQASLNGPGAGDTLLRAERFISLGGPAFPRPSTLRELIESMVYIARREEMNLLREAPTPAIARARFDSLWLSFRHDRQLAADLINRYYSRVEEANRRFTSIKEGWKTDQGMLFIVLGPPAEVMQTKDTQVWYYDLRGNDAVNVYTFQRRYVTDEHMTIQTFFLLRQAYYENFWDRMVDKWRSGEVF